VLAVKLPSACSSIAVLIMDVNPNAATYDLQ